MGKQAYLDGFRAAAAGTSEAIRTNGYWVAGLNIARLPLAVWTNPQSDWLQGFRDGFASAYGA